MPVEKNQTPHLVQQSRGFQSPKINVRGIKYEILVLSGEAGPPCVRFADYPGPQLQFAQRKIVSG